MSTPEGQDVSRVHHHSQGVQSASRIDSIWGNPLLLPHIVAHRFEDTTSDHRAVSMDLNLTMAERPPRNPVGPGFWRLHPGVFADDEYGTTLQTWAKDFRRTKDFSLVEALQTWSRFQLRLRSVVY